LTFLWKSIRSDSETTVLKGREREDVKETHLSKTRLPGTLDHQAAKNILCHYCFYMVSTNFLYIRLIINVTQLHNNVALELVFIHHTEDCLDDVHSNLIVLPTISPPTNVRFSPVVDG